MKKLILMALAFWAFSASAQPLFSLKKTPNTLKPVVEKVAADYSQNFDNIKGDTISVSDNMIVFTSKAAPSDALSTSITKYTDPYSYTWQATMFQSEDYEEASEKYKEYYKQLNGSTITFFDKTKYKLNGPFDTPDEGRAFASSILQLNPSNRNLQFFKVEVSMDYSLPQWTVKVLIYEKMSDDQIRPTNEIPIN
ncbi:MAG: hypothetical protein ACTHNG_16585 [Ginsengibacter sp.]